MHIKWPPKGPVIPNAANAVEVKVLRKVGSNPPDDSLNIPAQVFVRPPDLGGGEQDVVFDDLPVTTSNVHLVVRARAYEQASLAPPILAEGSAQISITAGNTTTFSVTMASTVDHLKATVSGNDVSNFVFPQTQTVDVTFTPVNAAGDMVLVDPTGVVFSGSNGVNITPTGPWTITLGAAKGNHSVYVSTQEPNIFSTATFQAYAYPTFTFQSSNIDATGLDVNDITCSGSNLAALSDDNANQKPSKWSVVPPGTDLATTLNALTQTITSFGTSPRGRTTGFPTGQQFGALKGDNVVYKFSNGATGGTVYHTLGNNDDFVDLCEASAGDDVFILYRKKSGQNFAVTLDDVSGSTTSFTPKNTAGTSNLAVSPSILNNRYVIIQAGSVAEVYTLKSGVLTFVRNIADGAVADIATDGAALFALDAAGQQIHLYLLSSGTEITGPGAPISFDNAQTSLAGFTPDRLTMDGSSLSNLFVSFKFAGGSAAAQATAP